MTEDLCNRQLGMLRMRVLQRDHCVECAEDPRDVATE